MKANLTYSREDDDLLLVTMKFTFDEYKGPELRKRLALLGYTLNPMDKLRLPVNDFVIQIGQANTSIRNEFTILRHYEIPHDFEVHLPQAQEHAERYYQRVIETLKEIGQVLPQYWK